MVPMDLHGPPKLYGSPRSSKATISMVPRGPPWSFRALSFSIGLHGPPKLYGSPQSSKTLWFLMVLHHAHLYGSLWASTVLQNSMVPRVSPGPPNSMVPAVLQHSPLYGSPPSSTISPVAPRASKPLWFPPVLHRTHLYGSPWTSTVLQNSMVPYGPL